MGGPRPSVGVVAGFSGGGGLLWVPVVEIEGLRIVGRRGFVEGDGLAVGEEAAADGGAVLGGFTVAIEEVELVFLVLVLGFGNWRLRRRHFYVLFFLLSLVSFTTNSSASSFSLVTNLHCCLMLCLT